MRLLRRNDYGKRRQRRKSGRGNTWRKRLPLRRDKGVKRRRERRAWRG
jgi:hypothetical protein